MQNGAPFQLGTPANPAATLPGSGLGVAPGSAAPGGPSGTPGGSGVGALGTLKWSSVYGSNLQFGNSYPPRAKGAKQFMPNTQHLSHSKKKVCLQN